MNQDTLQPETPSSPRFQFRLRSLFILMMITAFSLSIVPLWYQQVIIPNNLPAPNSDFDDPYVKRDHVMEIFSRSTPLFCFVAFASSCGLWYALSSPTKRRSDVWMGVAYAQTFGLIIFPYIWIGAYFNAFYFTLMCMRQRLLITDNLFINVLPAILVLAFIYSFWPLFFKRFWAALLLLLYSCVYGYVMVFYGFDLWVFVWN